ncbi:MAG TPA: hypothetical protein VF693_03190 [Allosphingosinicella sp.]|jgi:hypothetical protein
MSLLVLLLAFAAGADQSSGAVVVRERECWTMRQQDGRVVSERVPGLFVIQRTAQEGPFVVDLPPGAALLCPRSSLIPAPNDWKVPAAGHPLYLRETARDTDEPRLGVLEISQGRFRYRLISGELSEAERTELEARLNQLQRQGRED